MRRVLLDENLPRLLKRELPGFEVRTVAKVGWAGIKNGKLLRLAEVRPVRGAGGSVLRREKTGAIRTDGTPPSREGEGRGRRAYP